MHNDVIFVYGNLQKTYTQGVFQGTFDNAMVKIMEYSMMRILEAISILAQQKDFGDFAAKFAADESVLSGQDKAILSRSGAEKMTLQTAEKLSIFEQTKKDLIEAMTESHLGEKFHNASPEMLKKTTESILILDKNLTKDMVQTFRDMVIVRIRALSTGDGEFAEKMQEVDTKTASLETLCANLPAAEKERVEVALISDILQRAIEGLDKLIMSEEKNLVQPNLASATLTTSYNMTKNAKPLDSEKKQALTELRDNIETLSSQYSNPEERPAQKQAPKMTS